MTLTLIAALLACVPCLAVNTSQKGYGAFLFKVNPDSPDNYVPGLVFGEYDHLILSQIDERIFFLGETTFEFIEGHWSIDVERAWIRYEIFPWLKVIAGKDHVPLGYWNRAYHHGAVLHTTIDNPSTLKLFDRHNQGIMITGDYIFNSGFSYDISVSNGKSQGSPTQGDINNFKATHARLSYSLLDESLIFSISGHHEVLPYDDEGANPGHHGTPPNPAVDSLDQDITEWHGALAFVYQTSKIEFVWEYLLTAHVIDRATPMFQDRETLTHANFLLLSFQTTRYLRQYLKIDYNLFEENQIWFNPPNNEFRTESLGVRFDIGRTSALNIEGRLNHGEELSTEYVAQIAFGF